MRHTWPPSGSREYLLRSAEQVADSIRGLCDTFEAWGARRVIPSTFQPLADIEFVDRAITFRERESGALLALRQDVTAQIRRIIADELKHLPTPYRLYYMERVWVDDGADSLRGKERMQAGVEWIGAARRGEADLLRLVADVVARFDGHRATLVLGDSRLLPAWIRALECRDAAAAIEALRRKDMSAWRLVGDRRYPELPLALLRAGDRAMRATPPAVARLLRPLLDLATALGDRFDVVIDPVAAAEHPYYTGCFFGVMSGVAHDPWLRGGRYDGRFDRKIDALGFSLDLDAVMDNVAQSRMQGLRRPRWLWTGRGAPPPAGEVCWIPAEVGIRDARAWAAAHDLDGIAEVRGRKIVVRDPRTARVIAVLPE
jgi:ATP phosphoribosyltransferase regulatory subunit